MGFSKFTLRIILLFILGIISFIIIEQLTFQLVYLFQLSLIINIYLDLPKKQEFLKNMEILMFGVI